MGAASTAAAVATGELPPHRLAKLEKQKAKQDAFFLNQRFRIMPRKEKSGKPRKGVFTRSFIDHAAVRDRRAARVVLWWWTA